MPSASKNTSLFRNRVDDSRNQHKYPRSQDECLEVNKSPLPRPPYSPDPPLQRELGVFTNRGSTMIIHVAISHRMPVNVVTKKCLKQLGFENPRYDLSPELLKLAAKVLPWHCGWEQLNLFEPSAFISHELSFLVIDDDYYGYNLVLGREAMEVNFRPRAGVYLVPATPLGSKEENKKREKESKERRAPQAEALAERKHRSANILSIFSLPDVAAAQRPNDTDQEKTLQSSNTTPELEGDNSFVERWDDSQSLNILDVENEILFTSICNSLSYQLTNTYLDSLLNDQGDVQQEHPRYTDCAGSGSSVSISQTSKSASASSQTKTLMSDPPARHRRDPNESDDDDDQSRDKRRKRQEYGSLGTDVSDGKLLLACPYFKYDPIRYSERNMLEKNYRGCSSSFLKNISRLKQHLYRVHRRPDHYCGRCSEEFESQDALDAHTRSLTQCDVSDPQYSEKMTANQLTRIKRRSPGRSSRDTWYIIFKILFPGASLPNSPFAECRSSDTIAEFIFHAERKGPAMLSELINADLQHLSFYRQHDRQILVEAIKRAFPQVIRELGRRFSQPTLLSDLSSSQSGLASSPVAGEMKLPTTSHELPPTITPEAPAPLSRDHNPTSFEPSWPGFSSEVDPLPPGNYPSYQVPSLTEAAPVTALASNADELAGLWAAFAGDDTPSSRIGAQPGYLSTSFSSELDRQQGFHENLYTDDAWPNSSDDLVPEQ